LFFIFPRVVSKKECEKLLEYCIKNTEFREASILNPGQSDVDVDDAGRVDPRVRKADIAFVTPDDNEDNIVNEIAWHFLQKANDIKFNYKFDSFQLVQFARYRDGGHYAWHQDVNESAIVPHGESRKLSLTLCLTDPNIYEGGELQFYTGDRLMSDLKLSDGTIVPRKQIIKDKREQGSVIVFDSRDWHRVTPVTRGTRYSIVCWTVGPNFI
tara:strand:+ start:257 stop:892 length:636 start_codon:yes stop_codon:yes gene_type:complete